MPTVNEFEKEFDFCTNYMLMHCHLSLRCTITKYLYSESVAVPFYMRPAPCMTNDHDDFIWNMGGYLRLYLFSVVEL